MGKSTIMAIFNSYVKLPEGTCNSKCTPIWTAASIWQVFNASDEQRARLRGCLRSLFQGTCSGSFQTQKTLSFSWHAKTQLGFGWFGWWNIFRNPRYIMIILVKTIPVDCPLNQVIKIPPFSLIGASPRIWGEALALCAGGREDCLDALFSVAGSAVTTMDIFHQWPQHAARMYISMATRATLENWLNGPSMNFHFKMFSQTSNFTRLFRNFTSEIRFLKCQVI